MLDLQTPDTPETEALERRSEAERQAHARDTAREERELEERTRELRDLLVGVEPL